MKETDLMDILAPTADTALPAPFVVPLTGRRRGGLRNVPEGPLVAAVRLSSNGTPIVELEIDPATSGFDNVAWITADEAIAYAHAILEAAFAARRFALK